MTGHARAGGRPLRRLARLLIRPNKLRRVSDRVEGGFVLLLIVAFLAAVAAAPYLGQRFYQSQRATAAPLRDVVAVLTQSGPTNSDLAGDGQATARWRAPDGLERSGVLSTVIAPAIWGASAGERVELWVTRSGEPSPPPPGTLELAFTSVIIAIGAASGAGVALLICYWLCRLILDRRRMAAWETAWSLTGPRWSSHR